MSHRDSGHPTGAATNAQELRGAISGLLAEVDWAAIRFRQDCRWAPFGLVAAALVWAWSSKDSLKERFSQAHRFARGLGQALAPLKTSYQAFLKLLLRWAVPLLGCLALAFHILMRRKFPEEFHFAGFVILAADGSKLRLARTCSNEARYSSATRGRKGKKRRKADRAKKRPRSREARIQRAKDKKADCPQMALTLLFHVLLRLPWDWRLGPADESEREHLRQMAPQLPADALIVADCGFVGYDFWSELLASGRQFVIRVGGNVRLLKKLGLVRESDGTVYLWPDKAAKKKQAPLVLRLVAVHDGRQPWYLVTSVRDRRRLSDKEVARIYRFRWRVEVFFRHFKQTYGREKLRSHKAEHGECEAQWSLMGLWAMLLHAQIEQKREHGRAAHVSVAGVLRAFGQVIDEQRCCPEAGESLRDKLLKALVDPYKRRDKRSRAHPRKKYEPPRKPPNIRKASTAQCQLAKELMKPEPKKG
jgi:Transposase DDE domain